MFDKNSYDELIEKMSKDPDEDFIAFQKRIIPGAGKIYGVRMGELRKIAKQLSVDYFDYKRFCADSFEERMLLGLALAYEKLDDDVFFSEAREISRRFKTWAEVDCFCNTVKKRDGLYEFAIELCSDSYEYTARTGVILLMSLYLDDEHISGVLDAYLSIASNEYYVKMGIAWALSVAYINYRDEVYSIFVGDLLDLDTKEKAIRKCLESYRVPKKEKERLRELRKALKVSTTKS